MQAPLPTAVLLTLLVSMPSASHAKDIRFADSRPIDSPAIDARVLDSRLVVVDADTPSTLADLVDRGIVVVWNAGDFLLAVASEDDVDRLRAAGHPSLEIDRHLEEATYYVVSPVPPWRVDELASRSRVLWADRGRAVVDVPESRLRDVLDAGFEVARLTLAPCRPPRDMPPSWPARVALVPAIEAMTDSVSGARIDSHVARLQDFGTRYAPSEGGFAAAEYVRAELASYGIDSVGVHDWTDGVYAPNVVAVIPGVTRPDEIVIVGAHYDSYAAGSTADAPGADDNASGTALVLEAARVLSREQYARTLVFIAFGAEELGLLGSQAWVHEIAIGRDLDVVAMLNADMIGYSETSDLDMTIISDALHPALRDLMVEVGATYVPGLPLEDGHIPAGTSDHASFWQGGYPAVMFFEDGQRPSPFIHTNRDRVGPSYNQPLLAHQTVRLGVAFLATLADLLRLSIGHEPLPDTEDTSAPYRVVARIRSPEPLDADSLHVHYAVDGVSERSALTATGAGDVYEAFIPAKPAGRWVEYYLVAVDVESNRTTDPPGAPGETHAFFVGTITTLFEDDFESTYGWRARVPGDGATSGLWTLADPIATGQELGRPVQPEFDHTPGDDAVLCYVTGNAPAGSPIGEADVDGGRTTLESPPLDLSGQPNARLTYHRWFSNSAFAGSGSDEWVVSASPDGGATWIEIERLGENRRWWERVDRELSDMISLTSQVRLRFAASDDGGEDIVEAALDDVSVRAYQEPVTPIDPPPSTSAPGGARLVGVVPNPFGPSDAIRVHVPEPPRPVTVSIYDVAGRAVATLVDGRVLAGARTLGWDGRDARGRPTPAGVYVVRIQAGSESTTTSFVRVP